jgi:NAD(P)-dependent dehydrogenase (short-subunit alcohol dehydrogenase family)
MTRALAQQWAPRVRVNAVAPGYVRTDLNRSMWTRLQRIPGFPDAPRTEGLDESLRQALEEYRDTVAHAGLGRYGEPEEVAALAVYLCSPAASFVTGQSFYAEGGWLLRT